MVETPIEEGRGHAAPPRSRRAPKADLALIGREAEPRWFEYGPRDIALYALSVGAGARDTSFIWDGAPNGMRVLPSFCLVAMNAVGPQFTDLIHRYQKVEASETIRIHRPLEPAGRLLIRARIEDVVDKGSFALLVTRIRGEDAEGAPVFEIDCAAALLGSGGLGGLPARTAATERRPIAVGRLPDVAVSETIPETQAALYQLNGVDDPLHVDPAFARSRGFSRPILQVRARSATRRGWWCNGCAAVIPRACARSARASPRRSIRATGSASRRGRRRTAWCRSRLHASEGRC